MTPRQPHICMENAEGPGFACRLTRRWAPSPPKTPKATSATQDTKLPEVNAKRSNRRSVGTTHNLLWQHCDFETASLKSYV